MTEHVFTSKIESVLHRHFGDAAADIFEKSKLIQYLNIKTWSAEKGSKARSNFANLYAIYVLVEDYFGKEFHISGKYEKYEGAAFTSLFNRQRELPFGEKLQNHALNNRVNPEFEKHFPDAGLFPILRNSETNRYWINENLLKVTTGKVVYNISKAVLDIIDEYVKVKQDAFERFIKACEGLQKINTKESARVVDFIAGLLAPNVDARLFEIVSYAVLKYHYSGQTIIWGFDMEYLVKEKLQLYKTGRTNANDGGIDFVMRPLGRFFQVTETLDFKKYFLDIDKVQKYPVTFVIKSQDEVAELLNKIRLNAVKTYLVAEIVEKYMSCIEEVINIRLLQEKFKSAVAEGYLPNILDEIIAQSKIEFNYYSEL